MRTITALVQIVLAANVSAASYGDASSSTNAGIITPDIATDGLFTERFGRTNAGETLFCPLGAHKYHEIDAVCQDKFERSLWLTARQMVPAGKTYVGFRIVSGYYGSAYYEIYWK